jgi:nucleoside-triphosphatase
MLKKRVFVLTGSPGIGKTTVLARTVSSLRQRNLSVGGMYSREVREGQMRVGFEIVDVAAIKKGWLAHVNQKSGPQLGRYRVNLNDLETIGVGSIDYAVEKCDIVVIDEIGPMELFSEKFKKAVEKAIATKKLVIAVVHWKAQDNLVFETKNREDAEIFVVTSENRDTLPEVIAEKFITSFRQV